MREGVVTLTCAVQHNCRLRDLCHGPKQAPAAARSGWALLPLLALRGTHWVPLSERVRAAGGRDGWPWGARVCVGGQSRHSTLLGRHRRQVRAGWTLKQLE